MQGNNAPSASSFPSNTQGRDNCFIYGRLKNTGLCETCSNMSWNIFSWLAISDMDSSSCDRVQEFYSTQPSTSKLLSSLEFTNPHPLCSICNSLEATVSSRFVRPCGALECGDWVCSENCWRLGVQKWYDATEKDASKEKA
jgi:hypothetical protein